MCGIAIHIICNVSPKSFKHSGNHFHFFPICSQFPFNFLYANGGFSIWSAGSVNRFSFKLHSSALKGTDTLNSIILDMMRWQRIGSDWSQSWSIMVSFHVKDDISLSCEVVISCLQSECPLQNLLGSEFGSLCFCHVQTYWAIALCWPILYTLTEIILLWMVGKPI